ncbi:hypothetical protein VP01_1776g3 [Puccinia sorghi]|uniref:Uncharacterized protein n=1 Tax=Puccinia sorghi TaxID=27349 RepID=A0A0L6VET9_9BASI|nr:hypothetical protein VP01_1776g3 [Puccinia sorghi]
MSLHASVHVHVIYQLRGCVTSDPRGLRGCFPSVRNREKDRKREEKRIKRIFFSFLTFKNTTTCYLLFHLCLCFIMFQYLNNLSPHSSYHQDSPCTFHSLLFLFSILLFLKSNLYKLFISLLNSYRGNFHIVLLSIEYIHPSAFVPSGYLDGSIIIFLHYIFMLRYHLEFNSKHFQFTSMPQMVPWLFILNIIPLASSFFFSYFLLFNSRFDFHTNRGKEEMIPKCGYTSAIDFVHARPQIMQNCIKVVKSLPQIVIWPKTHLHLCDELCTCSMATNFLESSNQMLPKSTRYLTKHLLIHFDTRHSTNERLIFCGHNSFGLCSAINLQHQPNLLNYLLPQPAIISHYIQIKSSDIHKFWKSIWLPIFWNVIKAIITVSHVEPMGSASNQMLPKSTRYSTKDLLIHFDTRHSTNESLTFFKSKANLLFEFRLSHKGISNAVIIHSASIISHFIFESNPRIFEWINQLLSWAASKHTPSLPLLSSIIFPVLPLAYWLPFSNLIIFNKDLSYLAPHLQTSPCALRPAKFPSRVSPTGEVSSASAPLYIPQLAIYHPNHNKYALGSTHSKVMCTLYVENWGREKISGNLKCSPFYMMLGLLLHEVCIFWNFDFLIKRLPWSRRELLLNFKSLIKFMGIIVVKFVFVEFSTLSFSLCSFSFLFSFLWSSNLIFNVVFTSLVMNFSL